MDANFDPEVLKLLKNPFYRKQFEEQQRGAINEGKEINLKDDTGKVIKTLKIVPAILPR